MVVLKPLNKAIADNDHIYSVASSFLIYVLLTPIHRPLQVLGSSINSNGNLSNLHAPSWSAQKECIVEAFTRAGRSPSEVDFVELHATGYVICSLIDLNAEARA